MIFSVAYSGMTVADVAIEPDTNEKQSGATPPGTLPIIPPDPVHMAIQDIAKFNEDTGGEEKRDKEYQVCVKHHLWFVAPLKLEQ